MTVANISHLQFSKFLSFTKPLLFFVRGDLIEVYKWVSGYNKGDISQVLFFCEQNRTRNNGFKLDKFRFRKEIGRNWFTNSSG